MIPHHTDPFPAEESALFWQTKGCTLCQEEQYYAALTAFDRALSLEPNNCQIWNYRGNALSALDRKAEALNCYDRAAALNPTYHQVWFNRGLLLAEMQAYGSALESYDRAIAIHAASPYLLAREDIWLKQKLVAFD